MRECEEMLKFVQSSKDLRLDLVGSSQLASRQKLHMCQVCGEVEASTGQKVESGLLVSSQLGLAT